MKSADFRFYACLNDFLSPERRYKVFTQAFEFRPSVKDIIESLGVPHTEIDLILVNNQSAGFGRPLENRDRVSVFPRFRTIDVTSVTQTRPRPLGKLKFVLDVHLGRLATYLRLLGFDVLYQNDYRDEDLARISHIDERILLTKDRGLLCRNIVANGGYVRAPKPCEQVLEVIDRFDLSSSIEPFRRCLRCNALLERVERETIADRVPLNSRQVYSEFRKCPECNRIFWQGSHYEHMRRFVASIRQRLASWQPT